MPQTRRQSAFESFANILAGYTINLVANWVILPFFGYTPTLGQNLLIGLFYTAVSLARSYTLRRFFNRLHR